MQCHFDRELKIREGVYKADKSDTQPTVASICGNYVCDCGREKEPSNIICPDDPFILPLICSDVDSTDLLYYSRRSLTAACWLKVTREQYGDKSSTWRKLALRAPASPYKLPAGGKLKYKMCNWTFIIHVSYVLSVPQSIICIYYNKRFSHLTNLSVLILNTW